MLLTYIYYKIKHFEIELKDSDNNFKKQIQICFFINIKNYKFLTLRCIRMVGCENS